MSEEKIKINCILQKIIFTGEHGFIIGQFYIPEDDPILGNNMFIGKGSILNPQAEMNYILTGTWEEVPRYGRQFKFTSFETIKPKDINGIYKYIVRICKFVGSKTGSRIIEKYGKQSLEVMKTDPEALSKEIPGITLDRAREIQKSLLENENNESLVVEVEAMLDVPGMFKNIAVELIKILGSNTAEYIRQDPYILIGFKRIGFVLADQVALKNGYKRDGVARKKAIILHCLKENMKLTGSTWVADVDLKNSIRSYVQIPNIEEGFRALLSENVIVYEGLYVTKNSSGFWAFKEVAEMENTTAKKIVKMAMA